MFDYDLHGGAGFTPLGLPCPLLDGTGYLNLVALGEISFYGLDQVFPGNTGKPVCDYDLWKGGRAFSELLKHIPWISSIFLGCFKS